MEGDGEIPKLSPRRRRTDHQWVGPSYFLPELAEAEDRGFQAVRLDLVTMTTRLVDMNITIDKGSRVRLIASDDQHTDLTGGDLGTVDFIDDLGTIHVKWDKGNHLGLIPGLDKFVLLDDTHPKWALTGPKTC